MMSKEYPDFVSEDHFEPFDYAKVIAAETKRDYQALLEIAGFEEKLNHPSAGSGAMREKLNTPSYDLVPFQEITEAYTRVAEFGAKKYAAWNWSKGLARVQILSSLLRHTFAYMRGEDRDADSGLLHTDHILWNAAALSHNVHWNLEDGRRGEPHRAYKAPTPNFALRDPENMDPYGPNNPPVKRDA